MKGVNCMKNRILTFVIGVLVGAILATSGFLIYAKVSAPQNRRPMMNQGGGMRPSEFSNGGFEGMTPPEFSNGEFNGRRNMQRGQM